MSDVDKILANLQHMSGDIANAVEKRMDTELKNIQADAKRITPVDMGGLRNSITTTTRRNAEGDIIGTVGTVLEYAPYVEFGTGPVGKDSQKLIPSGFTLEYMTGPKWTNGMREVKRKTKNKGEITYYTRGWVYKDPKTGKHIYTEGQPAKPFLYPAFKQNESEARENILKAARNALKKGGGYG